MRRNLFDDLAVLFFRFIGDYFRVRAGEVSNSIQKKQNNIVAIVNICNIHIYKKRISYLVWYEMRFFSVENQNSPLFFI